ncbi:dipicolinate synthase subunit DpsA [Garciella nitratireducens]|uniref:Dipicolinate synthase subunit A n=1 Tax=Garciella nitratireducens DSM 15102 TaxID=1121911 RepID=A0A1T4N021_9FIRM|nr:dipicolinate synthase subunit DpsA [Garciella nitratireducens]SJZ72456.1 dipicolinate synthase subunit A [Garciella nitratireducens DSM 15102]
MKKRKFTILGGDKRNVELARLLMEDSNEVQTFALNDTEYYLPKCKTLEEALDYGKIIVGPLPISRDGKTLNTPLFSESIELERILRGLTEKNIFIAGKIGSHFLENAKKKGIVLEDYFAREEMQIFNAIPTAEGAIQIAMEQMDITLHNSNAMILGYGRIGKALSKMLQGIGANVYVEARKYEDLAWIKNQGYFPIHLKELDFYINRMDVVFNTVPSMILDEKRLEKLNANCIIIDLASSPGGVDFEKAKELGIKAILASGLPGKVARVTAAAIIRDTIYHIIQEREEEKWD